MTEAPRAGPSVLALDLGTSGPKVALVTLDGAVLGHETEPTRLDLTPGGGATQDPEEWWTAIGRASRRLMGRSPEPDVRAVACTAQWAGTVAVDRHGRCLTDALIWLDARGAPHARRLTAGFPSIEGYGVLKLWTWIRRTGGIPTRSGKDPVAHIHHLRAVMPHVYEATHKFLEPKDFLNFRLTGELRASVDSIALHWVTDNRDLDHVSYDPELLAMAELDREKLPDLCRAVDVIGAVTGEAAAHLGIPAGVPVVGGTPDVHSAALGSGAVRDRHGHVYIGTSSWITCHIPEKKTDIFHNITTLPSAIPGRYFVVDAQETAGACLNFLIDRVLYPEGVERPANIHQVLMDMAGGVTPGSDGLIFTPWIYGERTPVEDAQLRGGWHHVSLETTRAHMVRAVLEGVAFNTRWLNGHVEDFVGRPFAWLNIIGGGARSDLWCQILADVLDRPIRRVRDAVAANARGAAALASVALGHMSFDDIEARTGIEKVFEPQRHHRALLDDLFEEFLEIHRKTRTIHHRIHQAVERRRGDVP